MLKLCCKKNILNIHNDILLLYPNGAGSSSQWLRCLIPSQKVQNLIPNVSEVVYWISDSPMWWSEEASVLWLYFHATRNTFPCCPRVVFILFLYIHTKPAIRPAFFIMDSHILHVVRDPNAVLLADLPASYFPYTWSSLKGRREN